MEWKVYIIDFPAPLGKKNEDLLISAIQNTVLEPTRKEMAKYARTLLTEKLEKFSKVFRSLEIMRVFGAKLQALALQIDRYIILNRVSDTRYELKIADKDIAAFQVNIMGKDYSVGKFMPHRWIQRFFRDRLFPDMGFKPGEVKLTIEPRVE